MKGKGERPRDKDMKRKKRERKWHSMPFQSRDKNRMEMVFKTFLYQTKGEK